jgi:hypothetical protein
MSQGRGRLRSCEVVEEARNPRGGGESLRRVTNFQGLGGSVGLAAVAAVVKGQERRSRRRETARPGSQGTGHRRRGRVTGFHCSVVRSHLDSRVAWSSGSQAGTHTGSSLYGGGLRVGPRTPRSGRRYPRGDVVQEGSGRRSGFARDGGTDSRRDQSFEAGEAGRRWRLRLAKSRATGKRGHTRGKGAHSRRGNRATAPKGVGVGEIAGDKASLGSSLRVGG